MPRQVNLLNQSAILRSLRQAPAIGKVVLCDGNGLYLQILNRVASWLLRYTSPVTGKKRWKGLGPLREVELDAARDQAEDLRRLIRRGVDPLGADGPAGGGAAIPTFAAYGETYIASHQAAWKSAVHTRQWRSSLAKYTADIIGAWPIDQIDTPAILRVLRQNVAPAGAPEVSFWNARTVTASRVRERIFRILNAAKVEGHRTGENPALWPGHLSELLPSPKAVHTREHHRALPGRDVPALMAALRERDGSAARAVRLSILLGGRTDETLGLLWREVDFVERTVTIPGKRMKGGETHEIPLAPAALAILDYQYANRQGNGALVFPGNDDPNRKLVHSTLRRELAAIGYADRTTPHGLRASYNSWAAEQGFPLEIREMAIAHKVGDETLRSYQRSTLLCLRRELSEAWAAFCEPEQVPAAAPLELPAAAD